MKKTILTELNKEAEDYANEMYRDQVRSQIPGQVWEEGHIAWLDLVYEKFAELIVAEAITVLQKRFMGDLNREDMEVRRCIVDVKKHFGVEE